MFKKMLQKTILKVMDPSIKPISGYDAAFLYSESPTSPMHVASLTIVEGSIGFDDFKNSIAAKMHLMPKFRQRLVNLPFNVDFPYWADDPNFDMDLHIQHIKLPDPSDWKTLRDLTASLFSAPLDLRRPLWTITFIEGLDNVSQVPKGSVAILAKIHHVMVDGMSGVGLMGVLFSMFPDDVYDGEKPKPYRPRPLPSDFTLLAKSSIDFLQNPLKIPKVASKTIARMAKNTLTKQFLPKNDLIDSSFSVPKTIFNQSISPMRTWGTALLSLERIKVLKRSMEVTVNDVILAICSGGIRKYLLEKDQLPAMPLVANVPISVRDKEDEGELNNQISNMLIPIATHIEDPIERLENIQEHTIQGKIKHQALGAKTLAEMADAVPFGLANLAAGVYSRYKLNEYHRPPFNVTISNVPGPQFPLYLNGHQVSSVFGLTPVVDGLGLIISIFSYNGQVSITTTSDVKTMPDAEKFSRYIRESANELEALVLAKIEAEKVKQKMEAKSAPFFKALKKYFKDNPTWEESLNGRYQFKVTGCENNINWQVDLTGETANIKRGLAKDPAVVVTINDEYLHRIHQGELRMEEAQIQGRVSIEGTEKAQTQLFELLKLV